ncbi:MAG: transporter [Gammaproteobacteria bacterium]|jgi:monovalent cation:proton antiporter-2 (CPA2) family protein|nr:transporter [Gammaproteobacteria bacterium]MBT5221683.1 transporter [Gammaproteobacteria bacterium]MBT5826385.1 transporter [Gammaproteobacteria bacterium]MBT6420172.1 transporter [Gammaproteobacteria bacterium]MBT6575244.1 transporter [Gammaproteobacteria bacterium]
MHADNSILLYILELLAAAVIAIPIFHRLGLGSVLGYLVAGAALGPWGLKLINEVDDLRHVAEFGVVFLLFLIGLEMKPERLWVMRRLVFGLGVAQVLITALLLFGVAQLFSFPLKVSIIAAFGLALSSTAFGLQVLSEKNALTCTYGRASFAILLLQDLAVVPLMAMVSLSSGGETLTSSAGVGLLEVSAGIVCVLLVGRFLLNPILDRVAASRNSEVFIAATLLMVLGIGRAMELLHLSMALGAFLTGLMLAESHYRHQIEADIEPVRGTLLGLFFMTVGMSIDFGLLTREWHWVLLAVAGLLFIKASVLWVLSRISGLDNRNALRTALLLSQAGEFGFVLFGLALLTGVLLPERVQFLTLIVALSMVTTPFIVKLGDWWLNLNAPDESEIAVTTTTPMSNTTETNGKVIIAGFGRVGRRVAQLLDRAGVEYIALDNNHDRVNQFRGEGFNVFFGDARKLKVLQSAGAANATMLIFSLDNFSHLEHLVKDVRRHYPKIQIHARAHDIAHCEKLLNDGANQVVAETLEAGLRLGEMALINSGFNKDKANGVVADFRMELYSALNDNVIYKSRPPN